MRAIYIYLISVSAFLAFSSFSWSQSTPLTCSPAPCVLPPTQVSQSGATDASISTSPNSPTSMLVGADADCGPGSFLSTDGGTTWGNPICMRLMYIYTPVLDPVVGYDDKGTAYVTSVYGDNDNPELQLVGFQKSSDGANWTAPARVIGSMAAGRDAPWLAIDTSPASPRVNNLYVSATQFSCSPGCYSATGLSVAHSSDGGATSDYTNLIIRI